MRVTAMSVLMLSVFFLVPAAVIEAQGTVRVYVTSADEGSGFASKGTDDSVLDLTKALNKKRRLSITSSMARARRGPTHQSGWRAKWTSGWTRTWSA